MPNPAYNFSRPVRIPSNAPAVDALQSMTINDLGSLVDRMIDRKQDVSHNWYFCQVVEAYAYKRNIAAQLRRQNG